MRLKVRRLTEEPGIDETEDGYSGVNTVWTVLKRDDIIGFSSRIFRIKLGGHTPMHDHDREHLAVVIRGNCRVEYGSQVEEAGEGCIITIPSNVKHRFSNQSNERLVLLVMNLFVETRKSDEDVSDQAVVVEDSPE